MDTAQGIFALNTRRDYDGSSRRLLDIKDTWGRNWLTFLSVKEETYEVLKRLRLKGEDDDALIRRVVEFARCYMILFGMEDVE